MMSEKIAETIDFDETAIFSGWKKWLLRLTQNITHGIRL